MTTVHRLQLNEVLCLDSLESTKPVRVEIELVHRMWQQLFRLDGNIVRTEIEKKK